MRDQTIFLEVPLPYASGSHLGTTGRQPIQQIALQLTANPRTPMQGPLLWYLGWLLIQAIYRHGFSYMVQGISDFLMTTEARRNQMGPDASDHQAVAAFYERVREEVTSEQSSEL